MNDRFAPVEERHCSRHCTREVTRSRCLCETVRSCGSLCVSASPTVSPRVVVRSRSNSRVDEDETPPPAIIGPAVSGPVASRALLARRSHLCALADRYAPRQWQRAGHDNGAGAGSARVRVRQPGHRYFAAVLPFPTPALTVSLSVQPHGKRLQLRCALSPSRDAFVSSRGSANRPPRAAAVAATVARMCRVSFPSRRAPCICSMVRAHRGH